ncbi:F-box protein SKIP23 [Bienertia sinuspersici]
MSGRRRAVCWSDLPPELLSKIAECLDSRAHIQQFRAVCKLWARAISPSVLTSKNILSPLFPYPFSHPSPWLDSPTQSQSPVLVSTCVFLLRSTLDPKLPPWLFAAEELHPGKLFVSKLLSPIAIKKLPTDFPRTLDFSYIQVSELAVFHRVRFADDPTDMFTKSHLSDFNHNRVVLFVHPSKISCPTIGIGDCTAMVLHNNGSLSAIRLKDGSELRVSLMMMKKFDDIVNFKGKIYAINRKGRAYMIHYYNTLSLTNITEETLVEDKRKRLAVSSDQQELFLIYRWCRNKTSGAVGFNIYKLNEQESKWERVKGFGDDRILFVTFDGCFFASANDFQGWKGNCIVFYSACFASYSSFLTKRDRNLSLLVYNLENDDCQYLASYQSQLFWPPPTWLSSHASSTI